MIRVKPYLQLIRLPNVFTAAADSLAGWLFSGGGLDQPESWLPFCAASMAIYAAGIALNDLFDYSVDLTERPNRPLPSGQVSRWFAGAISGLGLSAGWALAAWAGGWVGFAVAGSLIACVVSYNGGAKHTIAGPWVMGACRGLNFLMGMTLAPNLGGPLGWSAALGLVFFVQGLTWISRWEASGGSDRGLRLGIPSQAAGLTALAAVIIGRAQVWPRVFLGLSLLAVVALVVARADWKAWRTLEPAAMRAAVKTAVFSLVWLDVALVLGSRPMIEAAAIAILWLPAFFLGRWLYST